MKKILLPYCLVGLLSLSFSAQAIGPRTVTNGQPVKWSSIPINLDVESDLTVRGEDVSALISEALSLWADLSESDVLFNQRSLGTAVGETNICCYFFDSSACPDGATDDGLNPIIIDEDGSIVADFFGENNRYATLGFASIISFSSSTGAAVKGEAVFNTACLAGVEQPGCDSLSFTAPDVTSFAVHELGHFLGLDHSQVNLIEATDDEDDNNIYITTMFPIFRLGNGANFKTPERDDAVGPAQLYPSSTFSSSTWTITGTVFKANGTTELQCANVIARNQASEEMMKTDAISALTGDFSPAGTNDGTYEIPGLTVGQTYKVEVVSIDDGLTGSSGFTPCRGSGAESSPPQFSEQTPAGPYPLGAGATQGSVNFTTDLAALRLSSLALADETTDEEFSDLVETEKEIAAIEVRSKNSATCSSTGGGGGGGGSSGGGCSLMPVDSER